MEDLIKDICVNVAGFYKLWLCTDDEVQSIDTIDYKTKSVQFLPAKDWGLVECNKIELSNKFASGIYDLTLTCNYNATPSIADTRLNNMCRQKFIARLKDKNGKFWLLGSKEEPLNFEYEHVGTPKGDGEHTYKIRLFRKTTQSLYSLSS